MPFKMHDGQSGFIAIILMVFVLVVAAIGMIYFVSQWDNRMATVANDTVNLSGINYSSEVAKATNSSVHMFSGSMPWLVYLGLIFLIVSFISLVAVSLRR